jgi:uncharacterized protein YndB with AHSA1/START domain
MTVLTPDCAALTLTRRLDHPVARVWAAFTEADRRRDWFKGPPGGTQLERRYDFRVGGGEDWRVRWSSGLTTGYHARFHAIVPETRLTYVFDVTHDDAIFSVSLADVTFTEVDAGTTELVLMEALAYHAEGDRGEIHQNRIHGTASILDAFEAALDGTTA